MSTGVERNKGPVNPVSERNKGPVNPVSIPTEVIIIDSDTEEDDEPLQVLKPSQVSPNTRSSQRKR